MTGRWPVITQNAGNYNGRTHLVAPPSSNHPGGVNLLLADTVKIVKFESAAVDESGIEADDEGAFIPTTEDSGQQTSALPEKYSNPGTSELKATVAAGANTFDFALEE